MSQHSVLVNAPLHPPRRCLVSAIIKVHGDVVFVTAMITSTAHVVPVTESQTVPYLTVLSVQGKESVMSAASAFALTISTVTDVNAVIPTVVQTVVACVQEMGCVAVVCVYATPPPTQ